jgi:hypothetical protein
MQVSDYTSNFFTIFLQNRFKTAVFWVYNINGLFSVRHPDRPPLPRILRKKGSGHRKTPQKAAKFTYCSVSGAAGSGRLPNIHAKCPDARGIA